LVTIAPVWVSAIPGGAAIHATKIAAMEMRVFVGQHIGFHVPMVTLRLVLDTIIKGLNDVLLKCSVRVWARTMVSRCASLQSA
jgi:hypothetical protein